MQDVRCPFQNRRAFTCVDGRPSRKSRRRTAHRHARRFRRRLGDMTDHLASIGRRANPAAPGNHFMPVDQGHRFVIAGGTAGQSIPQGSQRRFVTHVQSFAVDAFRTEKISRPSNSGMALDLERGRLLQRIGQ